MESWKRNHQLYIDRRSNRSLRVWEEKGRVLPRVEHVLGEAGLDVARLLLARLLARLRHPLASLLLLLPPPLPEQGPIPRRRGGRGLVAPES